MTVSGRGEYREVFRYGYVTYVIRVVRNGEKLVTATRSKNRKMPTVVHGNERYNPRVRIWRKTIGLFIMYAEVYVRVYVTLVVNVISVALVMITLTRVVRPAVDGTPTNYRTRQKYAYRRF